MRIGMRVEAHANNLAASVDAERVRVVAWVAGIALASGFASGFAGSAGLAGVSAGCSGGLTGSFFGSGSVLSASLWTSLLGLATRTSSGPVVSELAAAWRTGEILGHFRAILHGPA